MSQAKDLKNLFHHSSADLPLAGLSVIELHAIGPVPFAGRLLQQLGAKLTRVSPPNDPGLGIAMDPAFDFLNRSKTTLKLDLKNPEDHQKLLDQLKNTDVLLEGFRPQVLERLQLSPERLLQLNPRLIIGRLSGWGDEGVLSQRAGHDINYLAVSGLLNAIGTAQAPIPPVNVVADFGGGAMHLIVGVLAMLARRGIHQTGGVASTSILAGTVGLTSMFYGLMAGGVWNLKRESNLLDGAMPFYRVYRSADEKFVAIGALEPKFYAQLVGLLGLSASIELTHQYKASTWAATTEKFAQAIQSKTRDTWAELALPTDACLSPVLDFMEAAHYPHNQSNALHLLDEHPDAAAVIQFKPSA